MESATGRVERIFSGMQPSGELHLGNYLGALRSWVRLASRHEALFCVVDQHAVTVEYAPEAMPRRSYELALGYLAAGVDPERSRVFLQSAVPGHTELAWYLASVARMGQLERMTQFKEKAGEQREGASVGLFTYPVLMAADILLYRATLVPVGEDQVQHIEFTRDLAERFNARYGPTFPVPRYELSTAPRVMGLDGMRKMSKSLGNHIGMLETDASVRAKLRPAFTDPLRLRRSDPGRPEVCNIFTMHRGVTPPEVLQEVEVNCRRARWGCGDCKAVLADHLGRELGPVRERAAELEARPRRVIEVLEEGARSAGVLARETLAEVRERMGLRLPVVPG